MKKVLLTAMTLVGIASSTVFGMYGNNKDWIDFLSHGNQLRARMDQFGFTLGNGTIKGSFGVRGNTGGVIFGDETLKTTISGGIGYTSPAFGIGLAYAYTHSPSVNVDTPVYIDGGDYFNRFALGPIGMHTPILMVNALNDNLRIVVPVSIATKEVKASIYSGVKTEDKDVITPVYDNSSNVNYMGLSINPEIRYYTGIDALNHLRFTLRYGQNNAENEVESEKLAASSLGFEFRVDFLKTTIGNVVAAPFFRVKFNTALDAKGKYASTDNLKALKDIKANSGVFYYSKDWASETPKKSVLFDHNPYDLTFDLPLGLSANSDVVSLYLEPALGYTIADNGQKEDNISHSLFWGAYSELYITPVKDLEFYFEMGINGNAGARDISLPVYFETTTGITWYLPSLDGSAQ